MNPKFLLFYLVIWCSAPFFSQEEKKEGHGPASKSLRDIKGPQNHKTFYIENIKEPEKKIKLPHRHVVLLINESKSRHGILSQFNTMECFFDTLIGDSLSVRILNEEVEVEQRHMYSNTTNNYYAGSFAASYRKINVGDLRYLSMKSPIRSKLSQIGVVIMSLSVLTLVATPFVGLGLQDDEKAQRRGEVFVIGLTGFGVSIPFFIFGKNKKYGLQPDFSSKGNNYWAIKQSR